MSLPAEATLVKQRRPREVAQFLRLFEIDDRHDVTNLLLVLGLRSFLEEQRRFKATSRSGAPQGSFRSGDEVIQSLRSCVAVRGRSMSPGAAAALSKAASGAVTPNDGGSAAGGGGFRSSVAAAGRRRTPSPAAPSSRCTRCFPYETKARSHSASSGDGRARGSEPRANSTDSVSPPRYASLRELMERDKRNFYSSKKSAEFQVYEPDRAAVTAVTSPSERDAAIHEAQRVSATTTATTLPSATLAPSALKSSRGTTDESGENSAESVIATPPPTLPAAASSTATSALDAVAESSRHPPCETRNAAKSSSLPESSIAESASAEPKYDQPSLHTTSIPPAAIQALWQYIRSQSGSRKNPLVIAAALPSEFSAVPLSPDFSRVYQSLLLAYHLNAWVQ